jgi:hypothetical protein
MLSEEKEFERSVATIGAQGTEAGNKKFKI